MNSANSQTLTQEKFIFKGWRYRALNIDSEGVKSPKRRASQQVHGSAGVDLYDFDCLRL